MIFDKLVKDKVNAFFWKHIDRYNDIPYVAKQKIVKIALLLVKVIVNFGVFLFMLWFFTNPILNRFGFEKTIVFLGVILVMKEWFSD